MPLFRLGFAFALAVLGATLPATADDTPPAAAASARDTAPRYPLRGVIVGLFPAKGDLLVRHEKIPGLLDAETMAFRVQPDVFHRVKKGETITATLIVREDDFYLVDVKVIKR